MHDTRILENCDDVHFPSECLPFVISQQQQPHAWREGGIERKPFESDEVYIIVKKN